MKEKPVVIIFLIVAGVILSKAWFTLPTKTEVVDFAKDKLLVDMEKPKNIIKEPSNSIKIEIPSEEKAIENKTIGSDSASFYSLYYGSLGTNLSQSKNEFDGTYGRDFLEIAKDKALGFYKIKYVYEETANEIMKELELSYSACSGDINIDLFKLNECNTILQGVSIDPYIQNKINETLREYRRIAQVNGISAIDTNKLTSQDYKVGDVKYTITTIGNLVTIKANYSYNK